MCNLQIEKYIKDFSGKWPGNHSANQGTCNLISPDKSSSRLEWPAEFTIIGDKLTLMVHMRQFTGQCTFQSQKLSN